MSDLPLWGAVAVFALSVLAIAMAGTRMARLADHLADRTGMGEAMMGAVFLGISTSLPGISASVTTALEGFPAIAVSNAMGGIAVQTAFLAIADVFHRRANLEHAAASATNLIHSAGLVMLLAIVLLLMTAPEVRVGHVHPGTVALVLVYLFTLRLAWRSSSERMWVPRYTRATVEDRPERDDGSESLRRLWTGFAVSAAVVMAAGVAIGRVAGVLVEQTGISESVMGGVFTGVSTSLPELVTTIAAVRRGALTLAVGDIVGGNAFDVLFVCLADIGYFGGSIYHAVGASELFLVALTILLNVILLQGLLARQPRGFANIGFESVLILFVYVGGILVLTIS